MAKIFGTIIAETADEAIETIEVSSCPELYGFEIRADALRDTPDRSLLDRIRDATRALLLLTMRSPVGRGPGEPDRELLEEALEAGFDLVDVEWHPSVDCDWIAENASRIVLSHHDPAMPDIDRLVDEMSARSARHLKIIGTPSRFIEDAQLLGALKRHVAAGFNNLTLFGMGSQAHYSRMAAPRCGSALTFVSLSERPGAPGQLSLARAIECRLDADTRAASVFALIGSPVDHSGSPPIHNREYDARGVAATYSLIETLDPGVVLEAISENRPGAPDGLSVTTPHKLFCREEAERLGWRMTDRAAESMAVNTIWRDDQGVMHTDNTDVIGFETLLRDSSATGRCVILGAGATARAAIVAARTEGLDPVIAARLSPTTDQTVESMGVERIDLGPIPAGTSVVIDCIPAEAEIELTVPDQVRVWIEAFYGEMSRAPRKPDVTVLDGRRLLAAQAAPQIERFVGHLQTNASEE